MAQPESLKSRLQQLLLHQPKRQVPVGWWQDDKGRNQPPGSYLDPSLRIGDGAAEVEEPGSMPVERS